MDSPAVVLPVSCQVLTMSGAGLDTLDWLDVSLYWKYREFLGVTSPGTVGKFGEGRRSGRLMAQWTRSESDNPTRPLASVLLLFRHDIPLRRGRRRETSPDEVDQEPARGPPRGLVGLGGRYVLQVTARLACANSTLSSLDVRTEIVHHVLIVNFSPLGQMHFSAGKYTTDELACKYEPCHLFASR